MGLEGPGGIAEGPSAEALFVKRFTDFYFRFSTGLNGIFHQQLLEQEIRCPYTPSYMHLPQNEIENREGPLTPANAGHQRQH